MQVETLSEQLYFVTVPIRCDDGEQAWSGTGFLVGLEDAEGRSFPVLVTNRHVLEGAVNIKVGLHSATPKRKQWRAGKGWMISVESSLWMPHANSAIDVACMPAGPFLGGSDSKGRSPFFRTIGLDLFATTETEQQLDAIEDVVFVGYPSGIYDRAHNTPIARRGMTATPISLDYGDLPVFLVDASVFPGSSGSPVFLWNQGTYRNREGGVVVGSRLFLLGVVAAVHVRQLIGDVVEAPTKLVAVFDEAIDLGVVFKTQAIVEVLRLLAAQLDIDVPLLA